ncbi:putative hydroxymethylpyrimidine transporter CytX [Psychrobacillus vulpis]|uniref:putative hydroxymethylpyrimidine transporter CytX n=1 Tax=Psychrobacillus vulpis TaxID=2325572 RepID=UPI0019807FEC|nr:putative hydroxymethylpyrimidine transporter CytX [Psychrobacillus vulpis]
MKKSNVFQTSSVSQFFLWFGAAVSIAEILTGALIAPLGFTKGVQAILIGHVVGAIVLLLAGVISANSRLSSIEATRISFGRIGSYSFSLLNITQLIGWTAVMIVSGSIVFNGITLKLFNINNELLWSVVIAVFIILWIALGIKRLSKLNSVVVGLLFVFCLILTYVIFSGESKVTALVGEMSFGTAVELSTVMSLSWLPLIGDYTRHVKQKRAGTFASVAGYFLGSSLMYVIGLGGSLYVGTSDICVILLASGLGVMALLIVFFSTVTTTFLDAYSAGVSFRNLSVKWDERLVAIVFTLIGLAIAILSPVSAYESFLYLIGSVFAPLYGILFVDYFLLGKRKINEQLNIHVGNILLWAVGVASYHLLLNVELPLGNSLAILIGVGIIHFIICKLRGIRR